MIKDKIFECFDEYVEKRHDEMGRDYTRPNIRDLCDSAHKWFMDFYRKVELETIDSSLAEKYTDKLERALYIRYMKNLHDEKVREIRENISDRRERYRTEQSLKAGKV